jgi:hypothetical protein
MPKAASTDEDALVRSLASQFKVMNILWIVLTVIQVFSCAGIICAAWNTYVLVQRWKIPRLIEARNPSIVHMYENNMAWFISFLAINIVLGGVIGAGLIAWELLGIRSKVLQNRHLFAPAAARAYRQ